MDDKIFGSLIEACNQYSSLSTFSFGFTGDFTLIKWSNPTDDKSIFKFAKNTSESEGNFEKSKTKESESLSQAFSTGNKPILYIFMEVTELDGNRTSYINFLKSENLLLGM